MKEIKREYYLNELIDRKENGLIKIITGIRRCGKSYLLDPIFKNYLLSTGIKEDHIIKIDLEDRQNKEFLNPDVLEKYILEQIKDEDTYYVLLDEIQKVDDFESVLNGFLHIRNLDVYVTGSNSKFLSSDIVTEFRGRGDEVKIFPLTFSEFYDVYTGDINSAFNDYLLYGGLPYMVILKTDKQKRKYLTDLFETTYIKDIIERNNIQRKDVLDSLINVLSSSVGSYTNANKIANIYIKNVSINTINSYINYLLNAFIIEKVQRYDVKGKKYINTPYKYYFADLGLRNARLNFRQMEENHLIENIIYNELLVRGYNVDVGVVEIREGDKRKRLEVDFICNEGNKKYYIQVCLGLETREKTIQEEKSLININDNFKKIIVVKDDIKSWVNEEGIEIIGLKEFLLNKNILN